MVEPTNSLIGTEHKKWGLEAFHKRKKKGWGDKRTENSDKIDFIIFVTYP